MKATIEVADRKEAQTIRAGLADPSVRAFVIIMGALQQLPTQSARARVLTFVSEYFAEQEQKP
jgi:hypothetical protein